MFRLKLYRQALRRSWYESAWLSRSLPTAVDTDKGIGRLTERARLIKGEYPGEEFRHPPKCSCLAWSVWSNSCTEYVSVGSGSVSSACSESVSTQVRLTLCTVDVGDFVVKKNGFEQSPRTRERTNMIYSLGTKSVDLLSLELV